MSLATTLALSGCDTWGCSAWLSLLLPFRMLGGIRGLCCMQRCPRCPQGDFQAASDLVPSLQDIKRCLNALEELGTLQVTSHILQKHTDVVATLKKVGQRAESLPGGSKEPAWATPALRAFLLSLFGADPSL